jgi:hypothetical protein
MINIFCPEDEGNRFTETMVTTSDITRYYNEQDQNPNFRDREILGKTN